MYKEWREGKRFTSEGVKVFVPFVIVSTKMHDA